MATRLTQEQMSVWRAFLRAHAAVMAALEQGMQEEQGLPLAWYEVLVHLSEGPGGRLRLGDLAATALLTRSGITRLVDRMVAAELVSREPYPGDRRGYYAAITEKGRAVLERAAPGHSRRASEYFLRHLDAKEVEVLQSVFDRVLGAEVEARTEGDLTKANDSP